MFILFDDIFSTSTDYGYRKLSNEEFLIYHPRKTFASRITQVYILSVTKTCLLCLFRNKHRFYRNKYFIPFFKNFFYYKFAPRICVLFDLSRKYSPVSRCRCNTIAPSVPDHRTIISTKITKLYFLRLSITLEDNGNCNCVLMHKRRYLDQKNVQVKARNLAEKIFLTEVLTLLVKLCKIFAVR